MRAAAFLFAMLVTVFWSRTPAIAAAPVVLHTPGYEAPVRGDPDDLLMIAGVGFHSTDRVVYRAADAAGSSARHPPAVPRTSSADEGTAPVVQRGNPRYAITVLLPSALRKGRAYKLWVVTAKDEWSEPVTINDPRPQWISPTYVYSTADFANLGRTIRIVGRNLGADSATPLEIRLNGPSTYVLTAGAESTPAPAVRDYVAEAALPKFLAPGTYSVSVHRAGLGWTEVPDQRLEVRPGPPVLPTFSVNDPAYGACQPSDGGDDSPCLARAIEAAARAGGGTVVIPPGTWDVSTAALTTDGFVLPHNVHLRGAGAGSSVIVRHGARRPSGPDPLLTLTGLNSVAGLTFSDDMAFKSVQDGRPVIQLGRSANQPTSGASERIEDIIITENTFRRVGRGITDDAGHPLGRLFITRNDFGAYWITIDLPGNFFRKIDEPFRIDDSVIRWNRFLPGSYLDISARQGAMATGMGAAHHVDFSSNVADGTRTEALQDPNDPKGFRAAFFWNLSNNVEFMLIAENRISCAGDKDGDGEAIAFDGSGDTYGFNGTPPVTASGPDWVTVRGSLFSEQVGRAVPPDTYYRGHWVKVVDGAGLGQTRRIARYEQDARLSSVTLHVVPGWDVVPEPGAGRIVVSHQYWQVFIVGNDIDQRSPPCQKSNLTDPKGGEISIWTPSADLAIEGNRQRDTNGILFAQGYSIPAPSCPHCGNYTFLQTALEIRGNVVEGEYDWSSDCSESGIWGSFGASVTPESPPPIVGFGISISHNIVSHADGPRGGGIDIPMTSAPGPAPGNWTFLENLLIFHNELQDIAGPAPGAHCHRGQSNRSGIRLEGTDNVRDSVLYGNQCDRVDTFLADGGKRTTRLCLSGKNGSAARNNRCECQ